MTKLRPGQGFECHCGFGPLLFPYPHVYVIAECSQRSHIHTSSHDPKAALLGGQGSNYCSEERFLERIWGVYQK